MDLYSLRTANTLLFIGGPVFHLKPQHGLSMFDVLRDHRDRRNPKEKASHESSEKSE